MKSSLFYFLLLTNLTINAQTTFYQPFEVDSAAEPRGGVVFFNTFVQATLRKPVPAQAVGTGGRIVVEGVVEPNGHVSDVKALQSLRPDLDREAVRVFTLFKAWKPAKKSGQLVRQRVTMPITFQPNTPFTYVNGNRITYFGADSKITTDSSQPKYKQIAPIDVNGIPTGDIIVYELKRNSSKEVSRLPLVRKNNAYSNSSGKPVHLIGYPNSVIQWEGLLTGIDETGALIRQVYFQNGKPVGTELTYYPNGAVAEKKDELEDKYATTTWYMNGQIKEIKSANHPNAIVQNIPDQVTAFWDSTGTQIIKEGHGQAIYQTSVQSNSDTTKRTLFVEQGLYENGFKQGIWTGRYADGSYFYEETYDKGVVQSGKAQSAGVDTVRYTSVMQPPEFLGGMQRLGQFLSQNLNYPISAQKAGAQGKVFVSFVVCTDGTLCDYEVLKGVQPDLDREAVRVIQKMSGKWKSGFQRGQKVRVKYNLPINFTLN